MYMLLTILLICDIIYYSVKTEVVLGDWKYEYLYFHLHFHLKYLTSKLGYVQECEDTEDTESDCYTDIRKYVEFR